MYKLDDVTVVDGEYKVQALFIGLPLNNKRMFMLTRYYKKLNDSDYLVITSSYGNNEFTEKYK